MGIRVRNMVRLLRVTATAAAVLILAPSTASGASADEPVVASIRVAPPQGLAKNWASAANGASIVSISSVRAASMGAELLIDGNHTSNWASAAGATVDQHVRIALGGDSPVLNRVVLRTWVSSHAPKDYELWGRQSGADSDVLLASGQLPQQPLSEITFTADRLTELELRMKSTWTEPYLYIGEIEAYGPDRQGGVVSRSEGPPARVVDASSEALPASSILTPAGAWRSTGRTNEWVTVQLGGAHERLIDKLRLRSASSAESPGDFLLEVSSVGVEGPWTPVLTTRGAATTSWQEFDFSPTLARFVRVVIASPQNTTVCCTRIDELQVLSSGQNVASAAQVGAYVRSASSGASSAINAIDSSDATMWQASTSTGEHLVVSLVDGQSYPIDHVRLVSRAGSMSVRDYRVSVSDDATAAPDTFVTVAEGTKPNTDAPVAVSFGPTAARHVRLDILSTYGGVARVAALDVFSTSHGAATVPLSLDVSSDVASVHWAFGDGSTSTEWHPIHTYVSPGRYDITATVTSVNGSSTSATHRYVVVAAPVADFSVPASISEGTVATFTSTATDAAWGLSWWDWRFGDAAGSNAPASGYTFVDNGTYVVEHQVGNVHGVSSARVSREVVVANVPPAVGLPGAVTLEALEMWTPAAGLSDKGRDDMPSLVCDWDFGDGRVERIEQCSNNARVSLPHTYQDPGAYTARLTVTDKDGGATTRVANVTVKKRDVMLRQISTGAGANGGRSVTARLVSKATWTPVIGAVVEFRHAGRMRSATTDADGFVTVELPAPIQADQPVEIEFRGDDRNNSAYATRSVVLPQGDVVFAIDLSGSMGGAIGAVKSQVGYIADELSKTMDFQLGLVTFGGTTDVRQRLTSNVAEFAAALQPLSSNGGGFEPGFQATVVGMGDAMGFRRNTSACMVVITDEDADRGPQAPETVQDAANAVANRNGVWLGVVYGSFENTATDYGPGPGSLSDLTGGAVFDIYEFTTNPRPVLDAIVERCAEQVNRPDLAVSVSDGADEVAKGRTASYTVTATNVSARTATGVVVSVRVPTSATVVDADGGRHEAGVLTWEVGSLATYESFTAAPVLRVDRQTTDDEFVVIAEVRDDGLHGVDLNPSDNSAEDRNRLIAGNLPPVADAGGPYSVAEGDVVTLDATASTDADEDELTYFWDLGGPAGFVELPSQPTFVGVDGDATEQVTVRVCDPEGLCDEATTNVIVRNVVPTVDAGPDQAMFADGFADFVGTWTDPAGDADAPFAWRWLLAGEPVVADSTAGVTASAQVDGLARGRHTARLEVTDDDGGVGADESALLVLNRPPVCATGLASTQVVWPANHELVPITVDGVLDADGDDVAVTVVGIHQDEPLDAKGDGATEPDGAGIGTGTAWVRAERSGTKKTPGDGRVYHVYFRATDANGASCLGDVTVAVPHDLSDRPAVDSGRRIDSLTGAVASVSEEPTTAIPSSLATTVDTVTVTTGEDMPVEVELVARNLPDTTGVFFAALGDGPDRGALGPIGAATCSAWGDGNICRATVTYTPDADVNGADAFDYVVTDGVVGWSGSAHIGVDVSNDAPRLTASPAALVLDEDSGGHVVSIAGSDVETPAAALTFFLAEEPQHGWVRHGDQVLSAGDTVVGSPVELSYEPAYEYAGPDAFTVRVVDEGEGGLPPASTDVVVPVTVIGIDDAPAFGVLDDIVVTEDGSAELTVTATDSDTDTLGFAVALQPGRGAAEVVGPTTCATGELVTSCTTTVRVTPAADANGADSFRLAVSDGSSTVSESVAVEVVAVNDLPQLTAPATLALDEDGSASLLLEAIDVETAPTDLTFTLAQAPANGTLTIDGAALAEGDTVTGSPATLSYQPQLDFHGNDVLAISVTDGGDGADAALSASATVDVVVAAVDDAPTVTVAPVSTDEDTAVEVTVTASDVDSAALEITTGDGPGHGTLAAVGAADCSPTGAGVTCTRTLRYTPTADYAGPDTFTVRAADTSSTTTAAVDVTIVAVNDAPAAVDDATTVAEDTSVDVPVTANDSDVDGDPLTVVDVTAPANGTVTVDGAVLRYTPATDFVGVDSFTYRLYDGSTHSAAASVSVTVTEVNDVPVVTDDTLATDEDTPLRIDFAGLLGNDVPGPSNEAAQALGVASLTTSDASHGTLVFAADSATFTPDADFSGAAVVQVSVCDDGTTAGEPDTRCATSTLTIDVRPVNDAPTALAIASWTDSGAPVAITLQGADVDGDALTYVIVDGPLHGTATLDGDIVTYTPADGFAGQDAFTYRVSDGTLSSDVVEVTIDVAAAPPTATAVDDTYTAAAERVLTVPAPGVLGNDELPADVTVTLQVASDAAYGTLALQDDGSFTYLPSAGYVGDDEFSYRIVARDTVLATATATITVREAGEPPVIGTVSPADGTRVTSPVALDVPITAPDGASIGSWSVTVRLADGGAPITIASGTGSPPSPLATLDPTVLANGIYLVTVAATTTDGGESSIETSVLVDGELKLGRFAVTFQDADVPLGSMSVPILRSYDSLEKRSGDFGYGWTMALDGVRIATNGPLGAGGWTRHNENCVFGICTPVYRTSKAHFVAVSMPDGSVESFNFDPRGEQTVSWMAHARFTPRAGTTSTLVALDDTELIDQGDGNLYSQEDLEVYAPQRYQLTTRSGQVLVLDVEDGLQSLRDPDGTTYHLSDTGITSTAGGGATWTRDTAGRIVELVANGATTTYGYDTAGDLVSVTDPESRTTTFTYDAAHRMLGVNGPGGTPLRTLNYDDNGRLVSVTDAAGNTTAISHDAGARTQTITDPTGRLTTNLVLDALGGVLSKTETADGQSRTWSYTYDANGKQTSETDPLGRTTAATYNAAGEMLTRTDALGRTTTMTYGSNGQLLTLTEPGSRVTTYIYDAGLRPLTVTDAAGGVKSYTYDTAGRVATATDRNGKTTSYTYDAVGRLLTRTDPLGNVTRSTYDANGQLATRVDALGKVTAYDYDATGLLLGRTDALGATTTWTYDALGRVTSETAPGGATTEYGYNANGQLTRQADALGNATRWEYDAADRLTAEIDAAGGRTSYAYDGFGRLLSATGPLGAVTVYEYDAAGQRVADTSPLGARTTYDLDALGRATTVIDAFGGETVTAYDVAGNRTSVTDPLGRTTTFGYDPLGRLERVTDPAGAVTRTEYDAEGRVVATVDATGAREVLSYDATGRLASRTDATGVTSTYSYDARGRLVGVTDEAGRTTVSEYDDAGRLVATVTPMGARTVYEYDAAGRLVATVDPAGNRSTRAYDAAGRLVAETDANSRTTSYEIDALGRTTRITDALGGSVALTFDAAGNQTRITDPVGVVTSFEFDAVGNRTAEIDGLGNRVTWTYDVLGRLASTTNARGQTTSYSYDAASQLTGWTAPEGSVVQAFDAAGRRTRLDDPSGTTTFDYDAAGRLTSMASAAGTVGFGYDAAGRRTSLVVDGVTTGYAYDATGRLATVSTAAGDIAYAHDDDGRVATVTRPNGVLSSYSYNAAGRVTSIHHDRAGTPVAHFDYTVDPVGNRLAVQTLDGTESYTLDAGYRLTRVEYADGAVQEFEYDAAGNRTAITEGGHRSPYVYDAAGRLVEVDGVEVTRDADGNLTGLGDVSYAFDSANRLVGVTTADETASYTYDADGRRVHATENGVDTARLFDPTGDYPVLLGLGDETYDRSPHGDLLGVTAADGVERSPLTDALTSVRALTDPAGALVGRTDFEAYGATRVTSGNTSALDYTAAPIGVAGLVDLNARAYAPGLGAFLQRDTVRPGGRGTAGWNLYGYAEAMPATLTDPSGRTTLGEVSVVSSTDVRTSGAASIAAHAALQRFRQLFARALVDLVGANLAIYAATNGSAYSSLPDWTDPTNKKSWRNVPLPEPMPPRVDTQNPPGSSSMRFQFQQGTTQHACSQNVWNNAATGVTSEQAIAALFVAWSQCPQDLRKASQAAVYQMAEWITEKPPMGVGGMGTVKQYYFEYNRRSWRLDADNIGHNLRE